MLSAHARDALLDLNYILLFIAVASPLILLARLRAWRGAHPGGWGAAALIVLVGTATSWLLWPNGAGYLAGTLWALLLLAPAVAEKKIASLLIERRFAAARRLAFVRRVLHPWHDTGELTAFLRPLELAKAGRLPEALDQLAILRGQKSAAAYRATALTFALTENWAGLRAWAREHPGLTNDPAVRLQYLRALGETGAVDDLAWLVAARHPGAGFRLTMTPAFAQELLFLLAFCGQKNAIVRLSRGALAGWPRAHREFWIATSELAAGENAAGLARLHELRGKTGDAVLERAIVYRERHAEKIASPAVSAASEKLIARWRGEIRATESAALATGAPAVWTLIVLNALMFSVELLRGGPDRAHVLHRLGALEPDIILAGHGWWRLLAALFLHAGWLHLVFNLYALYLLGPPLEQLIGSTKFAIGYLVAGLGSSAGVVLLHALRLTKAIRLVGASGAIMGVVGISAGLLLMRKNAILGGRGLRDILVIVALQTVFDFTTPQVSLSAHLCGFASGVILGLVISPTRRAKGNQKVALPA